MQARYTAAARGLHWLSAALVLVLVILGVWMTTFEPKDEAFKYQLYDWHESTGFTLLLLTLLRLAWRAAHPAPALPADLPANLRVAAHGNHAALYVLLVVQPIVGFLATNAWGFPFKWWGVVPIPSPIGQNEALAPVLSAIHWWCAMLLILLLAVHISAALWHHFVRRDGTLHKML
jgi:cytochrome b561